MCVCIFGQEPLYLIFRIVRTFTHVFYFFCFMFDLIFCLFLFFRLHITILLAEPSDYTILFFNILSCSLYWWWWEILYRNVQNKIYYLLSAISFIIIYVIFLPVSFKYYWNYSILRKCYINISLISDCYIFFVML